MVVAIVATVVVVVATVVAAAVPICLYVSAHACMIHKNNEANLHQN